MMGFSRYCLSSLDLTKFVVREHGGATAEPFSAYLWVSALRSGNPEIQESGNPGIWKSWNLEIRKSGNLGSKQKLRNENYQKKENVSPKMSTRSGLVGTNPPGPIPCHFMGWQNLKNVVFSPMFAIQPLWGPCCYPPLVRMYVTDSRMCCLPVRGACHVVKYA